MYPIGAGGIREGKLNNFSAFNNPEFAYSAMKYIRTSIIEGQKSVKGRRYYDSMANVKRDAVALRDEARKAGNVPCRDVIMEVQAPKNYDSRNFWRFPYDVGIENVPRYIQENWLSCNCNLKRFVSAPEHSYLTRFENHGGQPF